MIPRWEWASIVCWLGLLGFCVGVWAMVILVIAHYA